MVTLNQEREVLYSFKKKLVTNQNLSKEELFELCAQFEDAIDLASVSIKIIDRLRANYVQANSM